MTSFRINSMFRRCWRASERDCGPCAWSEFYEAVNERTRLVVLSTVNYATGFRPPLEEISRFLRERGVLLYVDGSQSVGALQFDIAARAALDAVCRRV